MKKLLFFVLISGYLFFTFDLGRQEEQIKSFESKQKLSEDMRILIAKLVGIRKATSSALWVKHGLAIGDIIEKDENKEFKVAQLHQNSLNIAYLDPYFKQNYYTSSTVLAFIKTLQAYNEALDILKVGIENNPDEKLFKLYAGSIIAKSKNDTESLILIFEQILLKKFDDEIATFLTKIYKKKYSETGNSFFREKEITLLEMVFEYGTEKNVKYAQMRLEELKNSK